MKRTIMNITGRQSRQDHASIRVYEANDSNENILASDATMAYTRLNYCTILEARLGEAQKEKDASEEELADAVVEEERADTMRASKDEEISDLLRQLKALLGEKNFQKVYAIPALGGEDTAQASREDEGYQGEGDLGVHWKPCASRRGGCGRVSGCCTRHAREEEGSRRWEREGYGSNCMRDRHRNVTMFPKPFLPVLLCLLPIQAYFMLGKLQALKISCSAGISYVDRCLRPFSGPQY
jgi:hypothetical protein